MHAFFKYDIIKYLVDPQTDEEATRKCSLKKSGSILPEWIGSKVFDRYDPSLKDYS